MKRFLWILVAIAVCFGVGYTARLFQADSLEMWYPLLNKPSVMPPNAAFPIAWGIIYVCMGVSVGLLQPFIGWQKGELLVLFAVQLMLNFMWSFTFFYLRSPLFGLVNILALVWVVVAYIKKSYYVNKATSWLFVPYALWLAFATYLNAYVYVMN